MYSQQTRREPAPRARHIVVIGAGPAGCWAARLLAASGERVTVYEEHATIGLPQHCTGIVTPDLLDIVDLPPAIVCNRIRRMRLLATDGTRGDLVSHDLVLDRVAFDRHLAHLARLAGATIHLGHRFLGFGPPGQLRVRTQDRVEHVKADVVIAADGPASTVARAAGMNVGRRYLLGEQIRVEGSFAADLYEVHLVVPGFFGWVVPESGRIARIGVAARERPKAELERLLTALQPLGQVMGRNRGLIPVYDAGSGVACRCNGMDVRLVGDAAAMVKATTGGGIVPGLLSAQALHASLLHGSSYVRELSAVRRRLWTHLKIRAALDTLSDTQVARVVRLCTGGRAGRALEQGSRDRPVGLLCRLLAAEPALGWIGLTAACRALAGPAKPAPAAPSEGHGGADTRNGDTDWSALSAARPGGHATRAGRSPTGTTAKPSWRRLRPAMDSVPGSHSGRR